MLLCAFFPLQSITVRRHFCSVFFQITTMSCVPIWLCYYIAYCIMLLLAMMNLHLALTNFMSFCFIFYSVSVILCSCFPLNQILLSLPLSTPDLSCSESLHSFLLTLPDLVLPIVSCAILFVKEFCAILFVKEFLCHQFSFVYVLSSDLLLCIDAYDAHVRLCVYVLLSPNILYLLGSSLYYFTSSLTISLTFMSCHPHVDQIIRSLSICDAFVFAILSSGILWLHLRWFHIPFCSYNNSSNLCNQIL